MTWGHPHEGQCPEPAIPTPPLVGGPPPPQVTTWHPQLRWWNMVITSSFLKLLLVAILDWGERLIWLLSYYYAQRKIWVKPLKETNHGMAQDHLTPKEIWASYHFNFMMAFYPEHTKWDQDPKFTHRSYSETTRIPSSFICNCPTLWTHLTLRCKFPSKYQPSQFCNTNFPPYRSPSKRGLS